MLGLFYRYLNAGNERIHTEISGSSASVLGDIMFLCFWTYNTAIQNYVLMILMKAEGLFLYLTYTVTLPL